MADSAIWIIVAIVGVLLVLGVVLAARNRKHAKLHTEAERIRGEVEDESVQANRRAALADETAARARAAKAEAEAKAAEAARLEDRAASHRTAADATREELDARREHADSIDPKFKAGNRTDKADTVETVELADSVEHRASTDRLAR